MNPYREPGKFTEVNPAVEEILKREKAKEIMKGDYFGPEAVKTAFGIEIPDSEIPPLPYTLEQLEQAKELGEMLILRVSHDNEGNLMTIEQIKKIIQLKMNNDNDSFFDNLDEYKDYDFYRENHLKKEWRLVSKSFVPDVTSGKDEDGQYIDKSTNCNYIHQTRLLRNYLKLVGSLAEDEERECSDAILRNFSKQLGVGWDYQDIFDEKKYLRSLKRISQQLVGLEINKKNRRIPVEIIYDSILQSSSRKGWCLLTDKNDWTPVLLLNSLVFIGEIDKLGIGIDAWTAGSRNDNLGVVSQR